MAMRRISCRASRSASSVTVQVFTTTTSGGECGSGWSCRSVKQFLLDSGTFGLRRTTAEIGHEKTLRRTSAFRSYLRGHLLALLRNSDFEFRLVVDELLSKVVV